MRFSSLYRASFYLMLFLATLTVGVDASESKLAPLFPAAMAVAGILAYLTVDRNPKCGVSRPLANVLALGSLGLVLFEYALDSDLLLPVLAHWLVYLQLVKIFLPKTIEDDWVLFVLGLTQVLIGAVINQADQVGLILFCWAFLAIWVLALFSLQRDAQRFRVGRSDPGVASTPVEEPYPGLLDLPFLVSAVRVMALTLALGGAIFLAMPRRGIAARSPRGSDPLAKHLTGFDDEVQLGQLGEILENDSVVMSVELYDEVDIPRRPEGEPLWRGVTMTVYKNGRWHRQGKSRSSFPTIPSRRGERRRMLRQQIKLESTDSPVLFGLRPMLDARAPRTEIDLNAVGGTISRLEARGATFDYEVLSDPDPALPQPGEAVPGLRGLASLLGIESPLKERLRAIADTIVKDIPPDQSDRRARALESYLRDSGRFGYTLRMGIIDPKLDPVEDFLVNRKEGHCEYFASALTLLLRSVGIPARMVNGFKGGDWNELARVMSVRQKHAHSWVEAYLGSRRGTMGPEAIWITLDPTPPGERQHSVEQVGGFTSNFRQLTDLVRYIWIFFVVGYNAERQDRLLYQPIRELILEARSGFAMMGQAIRPTIANLLHFRDLGQFISVRGFLVSFTALLLLAGLVRGGIWLFRRVVRWYRGADRDPSSLSARIAFYRRLTELLAEYGLERPPAETQSEFARRASVFLTGRGTGAESVVDVPRAIVDAFYSVRFGHVTLSPTVIRSLESRLDALEASLRSSQA